MSSNNSSINNLTNKISLSSLQLQAPLRPTQAQKICIFSKTPNIPYLFTRIIKQTQLSKIFRPPQIFFPRPGTKRSMVKFPIQHKAFILTPKLKTKRSLHPIQTVTLNSLLGSQFSL